MDEFWVTFNSSGFLAQSFVEKSGISNYFLTYADMWRCFKISFKVADLP